MHLLAIQFLADTATSTGSGGMTAEQITKAGDALTTCIGNIVDQFIALLPIIGLTAAAIFGINFIKGRFRKLERQK